jgi:hypothetical protein
MKLARHGTRIKETLNIYTNLTEKHERKGPCVDNIVRYIKMDCELD